VCCSTLWAYPGEGCDPAQSAVRRGHGHGHDAFISSFVIFAWLVSCWIVGAFHDSVVVSNHAIRERSRRNQVQARGAVPRSQQRNARSDEKANNSAPPINHTLDPGASCSRLANVSTGSVTNSTFAAGSTGGRREST
jgi:hypothetical protein